MILTPAWFFMLVGFGYVMGFGTGRVWELGAQIERRRKANLTSFALDLAARSLEARQTRHSTDING